MSSDCDQGSFVLIVIIKLTVKLSCSMSFLKRGCSSQSITALVYTCGMQLMYSFAIIGLFYILQQVKYASSSLKELLTKQHKMLFHFTMKTCIPHRDSDFTLTHTQKTYFLRANSIFHYLLMWRISMASLGQKETRD